mmetsp:Transcript_10657/g.35288  ORF Transcript_10657/g.35288 Transcript_10657/m.35288 type:complete len:313 (-) Transcript_10657:437-1375(-)
MFSLFGRPNERAAAVQQLQKVVSGAHVAADDYSLVDVSYGDGRRMRVFLPPLFPKDKPVLQLMEALEHPKVDKYNQVHVEYLDEWTPRHSLAELVSYVVQLLEGVSNDDDDDLDGDKKKQLSGDDRDDDGGEAAEREVRDAAAGNPCELRGRRGHFRGRGRAAAGGRGRLWRLLRRHRRRGVHEGGQGAASGLERESRGGPRRDRRPPKGREGRGSERTAKPPRGPRRLRRPPPRSDDPLRAERCEGPRQGRPPHRQGESPTRRPRVLRPLRRLQSRQHRPPDLAQALPRQARRVPHQRGPRPRLLQTTRGY